jgi:acyl-CoA hydrolase
MATRKAAEQPPPDDTPKTVTVKVSANTQVNHDGDLFTGGQTLELPEDEAARLIAAGIVTSA